MQQLGYDRFILGADVYNGYIAVNGWLEQTEVSIYDFILDFIKAGVRTFFCTDIVKDGMLLGPSTALYQEILDRFRDIHLIASGGIASVNDIKVLERIGCCGAIIGKALYEDRIKIAELC
jgi:phosphoribosylformimino-5-aminoimidazole carboxamide ribotide isomerase